MISLTKHLNERLIINKDFKDSDYYANKILGKAWKELVEDRTAYCEYQKLDDASDVFVNAAEMANKCRHKLSESIDALDSTFKFKKCKEVYMIDIKDYNEFVSDLYDEFENNDVNLQRFEYEDMHGFLVDFKETNEFMFLSVGNERIYTVFIGKK